MVRVASAMPPGYIRNLTVFYCHLRAKCIRTMTSDPDSLTSLSCFYQQHNRFNALKTQNSAHVQQQAALGSCLPSPA